MKKNKPYGESVLLYPGITLRVGSIMQVLSPISTPKKQTVDKLVDKGAMVVDSVKNKRPRAGCSRNKQ
ncbi:MAG: hypothetical protein COV46_05625 [Deltaproteobacteria bacterium CG11_big_fil_rev_8_21_14_0_20_49_13]|nr:MAG: hypothetical protein COV46_05625 [Deltaproteobacteria bacterium CG11_big_fil_rev_8_21_14_0_20_49_13]